MLDAAYALFCDQGFAATTMVAIAERAGVAVQTLYFTFHTKDELLQAVQDLTVLGDEALPPPLQPWYLAAVAEPDPERALKLIVGGIAGICARVAPMIPVFHAVAAEPAGRVWARAEQLRAKGMSDLAEELRGKRAFRRGVTLDRATDLLMVLLGPETYRSFVIDRGWSPAQWETWTVGALLRDLY
jgi:AcrR family transcriptional regulator